MTRGEKYPDLKYFAEEYEQLCQEYKCISAGDELGLMSVEEAVDKGWVDKSEAIIRFEEALERQLSSLSHQYEEN